MKKILIILFFALAPCVYADIATERDRADVYLEAEEYKKAFKIYRSLARDGDHYAQFRLAELYADGKGVRPDRVEAYAWSVLAAESGLERDEEYSADLLSEITDKDKAASEARKLMGRYGQAAQANRQSRARSGSRACTGSRLNCGP